MASELRVDTLKDSSGSNSVGMAYVAGGSAKAWVHFDGSDATLAADDSFNQSSLTDNALGDYSLNYTTSMGNASYVANVFGYYSGHQVLLSDQNQAYATGSYRTGEIYAWNGVSSSNAGRMDPDNTTMLIHGDLA